MKSPVEKFSSSCLLCTEQLEGEMLVPFEAPLERNCAEAEERGGTSKPTGKEPVSAGSGWAGEMFGPLPGYKKSPMIERSSGSCLFVIFGSGYYFP
jgi:hypothetical protein